MFSAGDTGHLAHSNQSKTRLDSVIYSADYPSVQDAIDDAVLVARPLVIEPKLHTVTTPYTIQNAVDVSVSAYGATFRAGADLPRMLDMDGTARTTWHGGIFEIPSPYTVTDTIYIHREEGHFVSTINTFRDVQILGRYVTGVRVGRQGDTGQCDHALLDNLVLVGTDGVSLHGLYIGSGVYANNLNHVITNLRAAYHQTHVYVDGTNVHCDGVFTGYGETDFRVGSTMFSVKNVRSETAERFLITGGPASYAANITIENVIFEAGLVPQDGEWLRLYLAGYTSVKNVVVANAPVTAKIKADAPAPLLLSVDGLTSKSLYTEAIDANINTTVANRGYVQVAGNGIVEAVTHDG